MIELIFNILFPSGGAYLAFEPITLAALALSLAGSAVSMGGSAAANKNRQGNLDKEKAESNAWYNKEYYTQELDRTENASMLRTLTDRLKDQNTQDQATAAITGATPEVAVARKAANNKVYADAVNRLAGMASQRKDLIGRSWRADKRALYGMQDNIDASKLQTWQNLGSNAAGLGANALMLGVDGTPSGTTPGIGYAARKVIDRVTTPVF
jgi:hypothetical protein